jgi:hypothetical protein
LVLSRQCLRERVQVPGSIPADLALPGHYNCLGVSGSLLGAGGWDQLGVCAASVGSAPSCSSEGWGRGARQGPVYTTPYILNCDCDSVQGGPPGEPPLTGSFLPASRWQEGTESRVIESSCMPGLCLWKVTVYPGILPTRRRVVGANAS